MVGGWPRPERARVGHEVRRLAAVVGNGLGVRAELEERADALGVPKGGGGVPFVPGDPVGLWRVRFVSSEERDGAEVRMLDELDSVSCEASSVRVTLAEVKGGAEIASMDYGFGGGAAGGGGGADAIGQVAGFGAGFLAGGGGFGGLVLGNAASRTLGG